MPEIALGVYGFTRRHTQIEHQQRHGDGEDSVAEGCQAFHALPGNTVIRRVHRKESSTGGRAFMSRMQAEVKDACLPLRCALRSETALPALSQHSFFFQ